MKTQHDTDHLQAKGRGLRRNQAEDTLILDSSSELWGEKVLYIQSVLFVWQPEQTNIEVYFYYLNKKW